MRHPNGFTRRELLKQGTAAAMAAPALLASSARAAPVQAGANEQIGIGIIGPGRQGMDLLKQVGKMGRIVAVADVNVPRAESCAAQYNAKAFHDYRGLLDLQDVDAVIVTTPDHWRPLCCIHAAQAGKDIFAEKCLTLTIQEGRLMADAVRRYKRVFQTGSQQRSMAPNRLGCELVRNGRIGKVHTVVGHNYPSPWEARLPAQPIPAGLDWDRWCGPVDPIEFHNDIYTPRANPGWLSLRPFGGGEMTGWGSHGLDQVQWGLGMDDSGPVEVWVEGEKFDPPVYTEPASREAGDARGRQPMIFYRYADGTVLKLDNGPNGGAIFIGEHGRITINRNRLSSDPPEVAAEAVEEAAAQPYKNDDHMRDWIECIRSRRLCVAGIEVGHRTSTVCHLGNIARWLHRSLKWDPEREVFVGDDEANTYLDRPRRRGYELPEAV